MSFVIKVIKHFGVRNHGKIYNILYYYFEPKMGAIFLNDLNDK